MRPGSIVVLALAALLPAMAVAGVRDVRWFVAHQAERLQTELDCMNGQNSDRNPDCAAAQTAGWIVLREQARRASHSGALDTDLTHIAYWHANPIARAATLRECAHPVVGSQIRPSRLSCLAAAEAHILASGGARR